jgi:hypothetical protein
MRKAKEDELGLGTWVCLLFNCGLVWVSLGWFVRICVTMDTKGNKKNIPNQTLKPDHHFTENQNGPHF